ncbi:cellular retinoic acid-binding protein 1-like [Glandiceps talaboti]
MAPKFAGQWVAESAENLELLYTAMGIKPDVIGRIVEDSPIIEIRQHGDYFYIKTITKVAGKIEASFKVGETYELPTVTGKKIRNRTSWIAGGTKLQIWPVSGDGQDPVSVYELADENMVVTLYAAGTCGRRTYVRAPES